ncbi:MAG: type II toxin-antitoxin system RelE/ParE family toxin [Candidatus Eisenbacteria bacterium]
MEFRFAFKDLELLYTEGKGAEKYPEEVVRAFLRRVLHIQAAETEQDLRMPMSVHYEQLKGRQYKGKDSMRLNKQWRLILSVERDRTGQKSITIHEITNHYN